MEYNIPEVRKHLRNEQLHERALIKEASCSTNDYIGYGGFDAPIG